MELRSSRSRVHVLNGSQTPHARPVGLAGSQNADASEDAVPHGGQTLTEACRRARSLPSPSSKSIGSPPSAGARSGHNWATPTGLSLNRAHHAATRARHAAASTSLAVLRLIEVGQEVWDFGYLQDSTDYVGPLFELAYRLGSRRPTRRDPRLPKEVSAGQVKVTTMLTHPCAQVGMPKSFSKPGPIDLGVQTTPHSPASNLVRETGLFAVATQAQRTGRRSVAVLPKTRSSHSIAVMAADTAAE